jgi:CheY-like chemotaxis protein
MCAQILALLEQDQNSQQVVKSLKQSGHNVVTSKNFTEAIGILKEQRFDLIISDVHLENGGSVFDFLRWVKKNPSNSKVPFVLFSFVPSALAMYLEDGVKTAARILGAAMYITMHQFDSESFRKQINSILPIVVPTIEPTTEGIR